MVNEKPNVLWLMTDEQRADSLGCYGSAWARTPVIDALAARGVRFSSAYTPSPVCVAARAAIITGRAGWATGVMNNHHTLRDEDAHYLTEYFVRAGYQTASFGKHHYQNPKPAFETQVERVLDDRVDYDHYLVEIDEESMGVVQYPRIKNGRFPWILAGRYPGTAEETPEGMNVADAMRWLRARERGRPFLLRVSQNAPHTPVVAPEPYDTMIEMDAIDLPMDAKGERGDLAAPVRECLMTPAGAYQLSEAQLKRARQCYMGRVAFVDAMFGRLVEELACEGVLENTIVVFMSDHGAHLGDHGLVQKQSFYEESARVPLVLAGPGVRRGAVAEGCVNVGGLLMTLMKLCGLATGEVEQRTDFADFYRAASAGDETGGADAACDVDAHAMCVDATGANAGDDDGDEADDGAVVFSEIDYGLWKYRPGERYVMVRQGRWKLMLYRQPPEQTPAPEVGTGAQAISSWPALTGDEAMCLYDLQADPLERCNVAGRAENKAVIERLVRLLDARDAAIAARR